MSMRINFYVKPTKFKLTNLDLSRKLVRYYSRYGHKHNRLLIASLCSIIKFTIVGIVKHIFYVEEPKRALISGLF